jgi:hypothetical protein
MNEIEKMDNVIVVLVDRHVSFELTSKRIVQMEDYLIGIILLVS